MKARIRFKKDGTMKFVGHLDIVRYFQKLIRRANIDVAYSKGYSPHQIMSFASPLGVGLTSNGEYFDIELNSKIDKENAIKALNDKTVDGIEVIDFKYLPEDAKNGMSILSAADYLIDVKISDDDIDKFLSQSRIEVMKKTKKSEKLVDIKPLIFDMKNENDLLFVKLAHGSKSNLKPDLLCDALYEYLNNNRPEYISMHRLDMYYEKDGKLLSLIEV